MAVDDAPPSWHPPFTGGAQRNAVSVGLLDPRAGASKPAEQRAMGIRFNHTIVHSRAKEESARFLAEILGLRKPRTFGHFLVVDLEGDASLDFIDAGGMEFDPQHYAFLVSEQDFDAVFARIRERGLAYWADPFKQKPGEINHHDGGRGVYFSDPDGHLLEILTRPYGSGAPAAGAERRSRGSVAR